MPLVDLPIDLLAKVVACLDNPCEISRSAGISKHFHDPPTPSPNADPNALSPHSPAEEGIRLWLKTREIELPAICVGDTCAVRSLCFVALQRESNPPARAAAGRQHSLFIDGEGRLSSCGTAESWTPGLLGHGEGVTRLNTPTGLPSTLGGERAVSVATGENHSLAITADGVVWSWGKLGHGDVQIQLMPKKIEAFAGQRVVAVSAGTAHSLAVTADGAIWSWGSALTGRLGHGDDALAGEGLNLLRPKKVEAFAGQRVIAVSAGDNHSLAITADGAIWSWGCGSKLGHGDQQNQWLPKEIVAFAGRRVVTVSAGGSHGLAVTADGSVWSWGHGGLGQLGHGDDQNQLLPKKVEAFAGQRVIAVSAAVHHSLALTADGAVWSWGRGEFGRLGHGNQQTQLLPKKVEALAGKRVVAVSAGISHSLVLTAGGSVWSWGDGDDGKLGHGDRYVQCFPKKIESWASRPPSRAPSSPFSELSSPSSDGASELSFPSSDGEDSSDE